ncbi:phosphogluconate dehydrogenase C-terminal domain-containing protein [Granulosicoccus sp. 3-233]|uniref:phosphogluconate dehydrogenase C-terminal domain-containing protein n=1 Tax=Granulosicoccus sp. 3-233 TaxID=3417969 RepID=UPI003D3306E8
MKKIALLGAGGKMGVRLARNLGTTDFDVDHVEVSEEGRQRLKEATGADCVEPGQAVSRADIVLLAVPDRAIGDVAHNIIDQVRPGTSLVVLDAAAPQAGKMPERKDVTYFITHPCHPSIFNYEDSHEKQTDFFGGVAARQHIVCALMQGPEEHYAQCEAVARAIYAPVERAHRCTVEQIAILEPALSETVGATMCMALREATDRAVSLGVPPQAARDFILGHLNIELAIAFEEFPEGKFSDGALLAIDNAKSVLFKEDWLDQVFNMDAINKSVNDICK